MAFTTFSPPMSGWHFSNSKITWSIGPFVYKALCGGMIYSALDYYYHQMAIPSYYNAPPEGNAVHGYILSRQWDAHWSTATSFGYWWSGAIPPHTQHFYQVYNGVRTGYPQVLCLFRGVGAGHHVVAIDASLSNPWTITTYDPNYPDVTTDFYYFQGQWASNRYPSKPWRGFFVDTGYAKKIPNLLGGQNGWRWCRKCQGLFFYQAGTKCPAGGPHDAVGSPDYYLPKDSGSGQAGWRHCERCAGLHFSGSSASRCPAGGYHSSWGSGDYILGQNSGKGEPNWRYCKNCAGLFWAGEGKGRCPAGSYVGHDPSASGNYCLPNIPFK